VSLAEASSRPGLEPIVLEFPDVALVPLAPTAGLDPLGGTTFASAPASPAPHEHEVLVDGRPTGAELRRIDAERAVLIANREGNERHSVLILDSSPTLGGPRGAVTREVIVDGWRVEVEVEPAGRAALRERARRGREEIGQSGPTEVHAIIPGVVVSVSVAPGEAVTAGQQLLVVEAMKMQNELRAPRDGTVERVAVGAGETIEVGDLLLVLA
jgi:biotin carboxyl carrier protein